MSIEINNNSQCSECGAGLDNEDNCYCEKCIDKKVTEIDDLKEDRDYFESRVGELEELLEQCKNNCTTCENRYNCIVNKKEK